MNEKIHIGEIISDYLQKTGRTKKWLAQQIPLSESAFCKTLKHGHIDTDMLITVSISLNHDFFQYYSEYIKTCK